MALPKKKAPPKAASTRPEREKRETKDVKAVKPARKATVTGGAHDAKPAKAEVLKAKPIPKIRIRLSAFDHTVLDEAVTKIIETAERSGAVVHGPVPLPTQIRKFTLMRATFAKKDARDQFEMRIHRRLIDLTETTFRTVDALQSLSLPNGVDVEIKMG